MTMTKKEMIKAECIKLGIVPKSRDTIARMQECIEQKREHIKNLCKMAIDKNEKYRRCYFWQVTGNRAYRERQEFDVYHAFTFDGIVYTIRQSLTVTCSGYHYRNDIQKDGKKSNITIIKSVYKTLNK